MKKTVMLIIIGILTLTNVFAQEVRGVEISLTRYDGYSYTVAYRQRSQLDEKVVDYHEKTYDWYYGYRITNKNSITVSISIEVYYGNKIVTTEDIVLESGKSYIMKKPSMQVFINPGVVFNYRDDVEGVFRTNGKNNADSHYVKYKAFKLQ